MCLMLDPLKRTVSGKLFKIVLQNVRVVKYTNCGVNDNLHGVSEKEQEFRKRVHTFCQKELAPHAEDIDKNNGWSEQREFWRKLGKMGFHGITVPKCYGGLGLNYFHHFLVFEEISRACPAIGLSYGAHSNYCISQLSLSANNEQKERLLPKLLSGEHIGALAMTEAESGSDVVVSMQLRADKHQDYYILNGSKFWITNGPDTDVLIVYARTKQFGLPEHGITSFILERGMEGFITTPKIDKLGMRGSNTSQLILDNCKVPCENIIGKVNNGIYVLFKGLYIERAVLTALSLGVMQACIDIAFPYMSTKRDLGQLYLGKMADMYSQLSICRAYAYAVIRAIDKGDVISNDSAGCVLYASEKAVDIALDTMQCLGVGGYGKYDASARLLRDAKLGEVVGGTNDVRRWLIGRRINEEYAR